MGWLQDMGFFLVLLNQPGRFYSKKRKNW